MKELLARRESSKERLVGLKQRLEDAEKRAAGKACVYATGSFGRREASKFSDLDLFIVGKTNSSNESGARKSQLRRLDEICIKADLIETTRALEIPEFSGDGEYLGHYAVCELIDTLGKREDDVRNTFTARLLLLLESCPLIGNEVYEEIINEVISAYWRDYPDHKSSFSPAFLVNDILRLWRTFCVNYEAGTDREPEDKKIKGKTKHYKLGHSRLLTCYSAIMYLLACVRKKGSVSPDDAVEMAKLTPTERIESVIADAMSPKVNDVLSKLLDQYESFLMVTRVSEADMLMKFTEKDSYKNFAKEAKAFGDTVAAALAQIGQGKAGGLYRMLLV